MTQPYSQPTSNILGSGDLLKIGSCKFNVIINIINITLRSGVAVKPKILGYSFAEKPKIFKSLFFIYFLCKKNNPRHRAVHVTS
jgi:hypothetical protein